jgi:hypothetical protein
LVYEGFDYTAGDHLIGQQNPTTGGLWQDPTVPAQPAPENDGHLIQAASLTYAGLPTSTGGSLKVPRSPNSNISRLRLPLPTGADPVTGSWNIDTIDGDDATGDSMFFSFLMKVTDFASNSKPGSDTPADIEFIAGFHWGYSDHPASTPTQDVGPTMSTGGAYGAMVLIRESPTIAGSYELGIIKNNGSLGGGPQFSPDLIDWVDDQQFSPVNDTLMVVGEYHLVGSPTGSTPAADPSRADDTARLWVNPTPGAAAPTASAEAGVGGLDLMATQSSSVGPFASGSQIRSFYFRSDDDGPGSIQFDELRIGTTWADVTPAASVANADFNDDGVVDGADFLIWQTGNGATGTGAPGTGDANGDHNVNHSDIEIWTQQFGTSGMAIGASSPVPEPSSIALVAMAIAFALRRFDQG